MKCWNLNHKNFDQAIDLAERWAPHEAHRCKSLWVIISIWMRDNNAIKAQTTTNVTINCWEQFLKRLKLSSYKYQCSQTGWLYGLESPNFTLVFFEWRAIVDCFLSFYLISGLPSLLFYCSLQFIFWIYPSNIIEILNYYQLNVPIAHNTLNKKQLQFTNHNKQLAPKIPIILNKSQCNESRRIVVFDQTISVKKKPIVDIDQPNKESLSGMASLSAKFAWSWEGTILQASRFTKF